MSPRNEWGEPWSVDWLISVLFPNPLVCLRQHKTRPKTVRHLKPLSNLMNVLKKIKATYTCSTDAHLQSFIDLTSFPVLPFSFLFVHFKFLSLLAAGTKRGTKKMGGTQKNWERGVKVEGAGEGRGAGGGIGELCWIEMRRAASRISMQPKELPPFFSLLSFFLSLLCP